MNTYLARRTKTKPQERTSYNGVSAYAPPACSWMLKFFA